MLRNKLELESAGLGSPPDPYYTNDVELNNRVMKHQNSYKAPSVARVCPVH